MALIRATNNSSGGGGAEWIDGNISGKTATFNWNYNAESYILIYKLSNNSTAVFFGEIGANTVIYCNNSTPWYSTWSWSNPGFTVVQTSKSFSITHVSLNFSYAYLIPITNTITL